MELIGMLSEKQVERYNRQILIKDIGSRGQEKLLQAKVLIIGSGGLGSPAAMYLAAAGVGIIGIADGDTVDLSNLQRQIIHSTSDLNRPKVDSAREKIESINPDTRILTYNERISAHNIKNLIMDYDFIIDCTDNFPAKFLINDACVLYQKPFSHAGVLKFHGQTFTYLPGNACFRCLFKELPSKEDVPASSEQGIIGVTAGIGGTIQAAETLRYILGIGDLLINRVLSFDGFIMEFRTLRIKRDKDCPVCGENPEITELRDYEQPDSKNI